jgi:CubicO group peptidase (beta-lactamase class C family)
MAPLTSLVVSVDGRRVGSGFYRGLDPSDPVNVKSVSKSVVSALVGIALDRGELEGVDQRLVELLPEYFQGEYDPRKDSITVGQLLSMTNGLETTSFGNYGEWVASPDWVGYAVEKPLECDPGSCMTYSTGDYHLLSAILTRATGEDLRSYARHVLLAPLGIPARGWDRGPDGYYLGGNNMSFTAGEMLRLGQLYLDGGVWESEKVLPLEWIVASWGDYAVSPWNGHRYGYGWWGREWGGEEVRFAWGYGGQFIFVVPRLRTVVVTTSSLTDRPRGVDHNDAIQDLLARELIPAIRGQIEAGSESRVGSGVGALKEGVHTSVPDPKPRADRPSPGSDR